MTTLRNEMHEAFVDMKHRMYGLEQAMSLVKREVNLDRIERRLDLS
ncbi:hypothetical protein [Acidithiobacillus sp. IBUN Pt1247-S3]